MINLLITVFGVGMVLRKYSRDPEVGWAWLMGLMLILPSEVRFNLPGALPELTIHRILLAVGLWLVLRSRADEGTSDAVPLMKAFGFLAFTQFCSVLGATEKVGSLKDWLGFMTEQLLFAWMVWRCIKTRRGIRLLLYGVAAAMVVVGLIAAVERYGGVNLAARFIPGMKDDGRSVTATFRHRILFGYFMAFGLPMMLALVSIQQTKWSRRCAWIGLFLSMAGSYLSISRGPWLGAAIGAMFMAWVGGKKIRRSLTVLGIVAVVIMLSRPGVYDTLERLYESTKTTDTQKGRSFHYRLELWG
ncbi:MAG: O-antigen ligase family protein, partial [Akkermansiaceae bacterium]|nr:O-antigen ligase family protein [Verrucomicrobiales bacterium]